MKKIFNYFVCLIILVTSIVVFTGCSKSSYIYLNPETYNVGNGSITEMDISEINVDWVTGSVEIDVSSDYETISIEESYKKTLDDDQKLRYKLSNGILYVKYRNSSATKVDVGLDKSLIIKVPASVNGLSKIVASTESSSIKVKGNYKNAVCSPLSEINLTSTSGVISLGGFNATKLNVKSVSGNVAIKTCQISTLNIETTSGGVYTQDVIGSNLVIKTVSGASKLKFNVPISDVSVKSTSGSIELILPESIVGYEVKFNTRSGRYTSEFEEKSDDNKKTYGSGISSSMQVETVSGNLAIKKNISE